MIKCKKCSLEKPRTQFYREKRTKRGYNARCIDCCKADANAVYQANPTPYIERSRVQHSDPLHRRRRTCKSHGITLEQYDALLEKQGGHCAMCPATSSGHNMTDDFCIDHDHITGKVRGLLCSSCNLLLGKAKADEGNSILLGALFYLKKANA